MNQVDTRVESVNQISPGYLPGAEIFQLREISLMGFIPVYCLIGRSLCPTLILYEIGDDRDGDVLALIGFDCVNDNDGKPDKWENTAYDRNKG